MTVPLRAEAGVTVPLRAEAVLVGERLSIAGLGPRLASQPLLMEAGSGKAVVFRYGVVVLFGVEGDERRAFLESLLLRITQPARDPETETLDIEVDPDGAEGIMDGSLTLHSLDDGRIQVIGEVLGKSVVLGSLESRMDAAFSLVEPLAADLEEGGRRTKRARELLRHIGGALRIEHKMVGLAEVTEKPELLWENPELERLYIRLADEFELPERTLALDRKLTLIRTTGETMLELLQARRSHRVEWYITILIVIEILLTLYTMFFGT